MLKTQIYGSYHTLLEESTEILNSQVCSHDKMAKELYRERQKYMGGFP